jgi:CHASE3 domain sensor protein
VTFSVSWARPNSVRNVLVDLVARAPGRVQTKLLIAFLTIAGLLIIVGLVSIRALSGVNDQTQQLIKLQREIAAYRQVQHDTTAQLYGVSTALLFPDDPMLDAALRQLNQFGYDLDRLEFVAKHEAELIGEVRRLFDEVQARTRELAQSVEELRALGEVSQAVNSTLDLETVLNTIVAKAVQLSGTDAGSIYVLNKANTKFKLRATYGMDDATVSAIRHTSIRPGETAIGQATEQRQPVQIADVLEAPAPVSSTSWSRRDIGRS